MSAQANHALRSTEGPVHQRLQSQSCLTCSVRKVLTIKKIKKYIYTRTLNAVDAITLRFSGYYHIHKSKKLQKMQMKLHANRERDYKEQRKECLEGVQRNLATRDRISFMLLV